MIRFRFTRAFSCIVIVLFTVFTLGQAAIADGKLTPVMTGLNNPRGLTFGRGTDMYVAEAGMGGDLFLGTGENGDLYFGLSGSISRLVNGVQERFVNGLPSLAGLDGSFGIGPADVALPHEGGLQFSIGLAENPDFRNLNPGLAHMGWLGRVRKGNVSFFADISTYEKMNNPAGGPIDSDPYGLLIDGESTIIAAAGENALLKTGLNGHISVLAVFPDRLVPFAGDMIPMEPVPTTVVKGPDGAYYVGELTGFPFPVGGARIYRVVPGEAPTIYLDGFTNIIDIAFDSRGGLYVLEIAANGLLSNDLTGALIHVERSGKRRTVAMQGLVAPTSVVLDPRGKIYVSNFGVFAGIGEVDRIDP